MSDIWSEANVERALLELRDTDEEYGRLKGQVLALEKNEHDHLNLSVKN